MRDPNFESEITAMSKRELAMLYALDLTPRSAVNRLMLWINHNPALVAALQATGYRKTAKIFSPIQVKLIYTYLGEP